MKNDSLFKTFCLHKTIVVILLLGFFLKSNTVNAQSITIIDNDDLVRVDYPDGTNNPAWDAVKDYNVPGALNGKSIYFRIEGADGDDAEDSSDTVYEGGEGATVMARFNIGNGPNEIPPGGTFRIILGEGKERGAGGGGTGLAFRNPHTAQWTILAVAGGGGAAGTHSTYGLPRPGRAHIDGYWGRRTSTNENNGRNGGNGTNNGDYGRGGRGYLSSLNASGEPVGSTGPNDTGNNSTGTFGFGGGGGYTSDFFDTSGGGGGGYSGGGGGDLDGDCGGGGGGSYVNTTYAQWHSIIENGRTASPDHGFAEFQVRCSTAIPNAQITDISTLNTNDCDPSSDFVWLNVVADPLLGSACGARLITRNNEAGVFDMSIPYSADNTTTTAAANAYIEKDTEYNILITSPIPSISSDDIIEQKTIVFPKFQWQNETEAVLTTNDITLTAQDLVTLTGTASTLIQGFSFQFLNTDGTIAEGEQKTYTTGGIYTQKIGLVSFAGTVMCEHEMTITIKSPEIEVNHCVSGNTEFIENIQSVWYRFNGYHTQWQSFSPEGSGVMQDVYFEIVPDTYNGFEIPQNATLTIHRGEGTDGQLLYTKNLAGTLSTFNTVTIDETLILEEDETYTFAITDPTTTNWGLPFYITDNYTRGRHFIWNDRDVAFRVNLSEVCDEDSGITSTYMEDTAIGTSSSKTFTISNTGTDVLTVSNITSSDNQFTITNSNLSIAPNNSATFTVNFTPTVAGAQNTTITINSNDVDEAAYSFNIKGDAIGSLLVTCKDNLVFHQDENGQLTLGFEDIVDTAEGPFNAVSINGSNSVQFNNCNNVGDHTITLEISTPSGTTATCTTTIRVNPQVVYPTVEDVTLYFNRGASLPTFTYDVSTFAANCASFSAPTQTAGLASGVQYPEGTTTNTFEMTNNDVTISFSFNVTVVESPVETLVNLENGQLAISDWNTTTDDDQITLSISNDGNTLYINDLNGSVQLIGSELAYEGDTGKVVSVPMNAITNGIIFNGNQGNNGITFSQDFTLTGANNALTINDVSNYQQLGALTIEGNLTITGDADIVIANATLDGTVTLTGNTIDIKAINQDNLTLGAITATGTANTDMNYIYNTEDIWISSPIQTAGDSNLTIRGNVVQQSSNGTITTNELILEGNTFETSGFALDSTVNNIKKMTSNTTNHLVAAIFFTDLDTVELGVINTGGVYFQANTYTFTENTNLTIGYDSLLDGGITVTATNNNSPAQLNQNGGTLTMYGTDLYSFTGAFQYTAVSGTTTDIRNAEVLIDTPNHTQTFGTLEMFAEPFIVAAGSTVNFLDKGDFRSGGTSLEGTGIVNGNVDFRNKGTLNPGTDTDTGTLTVNGNLKLFKNANSSDNEGNFTPQLNSDTDFDAVAVFGTVELLNADFEPTGSFIDSDTNQEIILINNDGTDAVTGTFSNLPEGTSYAFGEFLGYITYVGGDGNDVSLIKGPSTSFITTWKTDNPGTSDDNTITIPTAAGETYDYTIDWGDGTVETITTSTPPSHTYTTPGTVTVVITGTFPRIVFDFNHGDRQKITAVTQWGNIQWSSMESAFAGCSNLDITATDIPDLSNVISMATMFSNCTNLVGDSVLSTWDVSNVTTLAATFSGTENFNQNLSNWDTSNVTNMGFMFTNATGITQDFIQTNGGWSTSNVTDMNSMFLNATNFNGDISGWDTSNVTTMNQMFENTTSFDHSLEDWDISSLGDATRMFNGGALSTENYDQTLIGWAIDTSGVDGDGIDDIRSDVDFDAGNSQYCLSQSARNILTSSNPEGFNWNIVDGGITSDCSIDTSNAYITTWKTDNLGTSDDNSIIIPISGNSNNYTVDWGDGSIETGLTSAASHTYAAAGTYTVKITGNYTNIFFNNGGDKEKILTIEQWGNHQWTSMSAAYLGCDNLTITATDVPDLSQVTTMIATFAEAVNFNGDLSNWDVSNIQEMSSMFRGATNFTGDLSSWDTTNVTNMANMFQDATAFNGDISAWNTENVTTMSRMFMGASTFNRDIGGWNTANVSDMEFMFENATSFDQDLGDWDITNLKNNGRRRSAANMFNGVTLSSENYNSLLIGWSIDSSSMAGDGIDDVPDGITFHGGNSQYCIAETERQDLMTTYGWNITDGGKACPKFEIRIYLQGASLGVTTGGLFKMRDDLRANNLIPTTSPYDGIATFDPAILSNSDEEAIVDWIWVELRDATDNTITVFSDSFLIRKDGYITSTTEGILEAKIREGAYYVVVKHRNHLGIMSAAPITLNTTNLTTIDFTDGTVPTYGTNAQTTFGMPAGIFGMWTGNVNDDGIIQYSGVNPDSPEILSEILNDPGNFLNFPTYTISGYKKYDINMDGNTQYSGTNPDTPIILQNVLAHPGNFLNFSTYQITEQLPENE